MSTQERIVMHIAAIIVLHVQVYVLSFMHDDHIRSSPYIYHFRAYFLIVLLYHYVPLTFHELRI